MEQLILFRCLSTELTISELKSLFNTLLEDNQFDNQLIFNSLFTYFKTKFMDKTVNNNHQSMITNLNNTMNDIIQNRNSQQTSNDKKDNNNENKPITIESLSSSIINKIASYLKLNEMIQFELSNRRHFISVRYPYPSLNRIGFGHGFNETFNDLNWIQDYCQLTYDTNFNRFRCVNDLRFDIKDYIKYNISKNGKIFKNINKLSLFGIGNTQGNDLCLETIFDTIQKGIQLNKLKHLTLTNFEVSQSVSDIQIFIKLISCSSQLESLSLADVYGKHNENDEIQLQFDPKMCAKLPYLTAVNYYGCDWNIYGNFSKLISYQIKSLHINDINAILNTQTYNKLCEFCIAESMDNISKGINSLIKYAKQLETINMKIIETGPNNELEQKEFEHTLKSVMNMKSLKLLEITSFSTATTNIILNGLNNSNICNNKNILKIVLNTAHKYYSCKYEQNMNFDKKIKDLICKFKHSSIQRFVFVFIAATGTGLDNETIHFLKQKANVNIYELTNNYPKATKLIISSHEDIHIPYIYACDRHFEYSATNS